MSTNLRINKDREYRFVFAGGSYATITIIKLLSSDIIPKLLENNPSIETVSITVIAPNKEAYWNVAAVRVISDPDLLDTNGKQLFYPLESTLRQYFPDNGKCKLRVIQGKITSINSAKNYVTYLKMNDEGLNDSMIKFFGEAIRYDRLILATGASSSSPAFKLNGSATLSRRSLIQIHESVLNAQSIAIIGAGGVGVELAGELAYKYGKTKYITLYSDMNGALENLKPKIAAQAIKQLEDLNVKVITNSMVVGIQKDDEYSTTIDGRTELIHHVYDDDSDTALGPQHHHHNHIPKHFRLKHYISHGSDTESDSELSRETDFSNSSTLVDPGLHSKSSKHYHPSTILTFADGTTRLVDCCITATGNIPNTQYLPYDALDDDGYAIADPNLRMLHHNPQKNIYLAGDIISNGRATINDITTSQRNTLQSTLYHDIIDDRTPLKEYIVSAPAYLVSISKKGGVGTLNGFQVPSLVVTWMKSRDFRMDSSHKYLE